MRSTIDFFGYRLVPLVLPTFLATLLAMAVGCGEAEIGSDAPRATEIRQFTGEVGLGLLVHTDRGWEQFAPTQTDLLEDALRRHVQPPVEELSLQGGMSHLFQLADSDRGGRTFFRLRGETPPYQAFDSRSENLDYISLAEVVFPVRTSGEIVHTWTLPDNPGLENPVVFFPSSAPGSTVAQQLSGNQAVITFAYSQDLQTDEMTIDVLLDGNYVGTVGPVEVEDNIFPVNIGVRSPFPGEYGLDMVVDGVVYLDETYIQQGLAFQEPIEDIEAGPNVDVTISNSFLWDFGAGTTAIPTAEEDPRWAIRVFPPEGPARLKAGTGHLMEAVWNTGTAVLTRDAGASVSFVPMARLEQILAQNEGTVPWGYSLTGSAIAYSEVREVSGVGETLVTVRYEIGENASVPGPQVLEIVNPELLVPDGTNSVQLTAEIILVGEPSLPRVPDWFVDVVTDTTDPTVVKTGVEADPDGPEGPFGPGQGPIIKAVWDGTNDSGDLHQGPVKFRVFAQLCDDAPTALREIRAQGQTCPEGLSKQEFYPVAVASPVEVEKVRFGGEPSLVPSEAGGPFPVYDYVAGVLHGEGTPQEEPHFDSTGPLFPVVYPAGAPVFVSPDLKVAEDTTVKVSVSGTLGSESIAFQPSEVTGLAGPDNDIGTLVFQGQAPSGIGRDVLELTWTVEAVQPDGGASAPTVTTTEHRFYTLAAAPAMASGQWPWYHPETFKQDDPAAFIAGTETSVGPLLRNLIVSGRSPLDIAAHLTAGASSAAEAVAALTNGVNAQSKYLYRSPEGVSQIASGPGAGPSLTPYTLLLDRVLVSPFAQCYDSAALVTHLANIVGYRPTQLQFQRSARLPLVTKYVAPIGFDRPPPLPNDIFKGEPAALWVPKNLLEQLGIAALLPAPELVGRDELSSAEELFFHHPALQFVFAYHQVVQVEGLIYDASLRHEPGQDSFVNSHLIINQRAVKGDGLRAEFERWLNARAPGATVPLEPDYSGSFGPQNGLHDLESYLALLLYLSDSEEADLARDTGYRTTTDLHRYHVFTGTEINVLDTGGARP